jgi:hypothetical protein
MTPMCIQSQRSSIRNGSLIQTVLCATTLHWSQYMDLESVSVLGGILSMRRCSSLPLPCSRFSVSINSLVPLVNRFNIRTRAASLGASGLFIRGQGSTDQICPDPVARTRSRALSLRGIKWQRNLSLLALVDVLRALESVMCVTYLHKGGTCRIHLCAPTDKRSNITRAFV